MNGTPYTGTTPFRYKIAMSIALGMKHVYAGTVDPAVVAKRRAANKRARAARRIARKAAR